MSCTYESFSLRTSWYLGKRIRSGWDILMYWHWRELRILTTTWRERVCRNKCIWVYWWLYWHLRKSTISKYLLIFVYDRSYIWERVRNWARLIRKSSILAFLFFLIFSLFWVRLSLFRFFDNRDIIQYLRANHAPKKRKIS